MRYLIPFLLSICFTHQYAPAQTYEVGVFLGGSNFIGDIGETIYISPNQLTIGGIAKWNRSPRHSFRVSAILSELQGIDSDSNDPRRRQRNYQFNTTILELSAGIEFTFIEFDLHKSTPQVSPYLYTGISIANHRNYFFSQTGQRTSEDTFSFAYGIPMTLGAKTNITPHIIFAAEIGARYTFSDELDGSVPDNKARAETLSFGNTNNNDWYVFSGITLTYTFGKQPCFCSF